MSTLEDKRFHGRRRGRRLRKKRQRLLDNLLPNYELQLTVDSRNLDLTNLFKDPVDEIWLEIGFGNGEHLIWQAKNYKNVGFLNVFGEGFRALFLRRPSGHIQRGGGGRA